MNHKNPRNSSPKGAHVLVQLLVRLRRKRKRWTQKNIGNFHMWQLLFSQHLQREKTPSLCLFEDFPTYQAAFISWFIHFSVVMMGGESKNLTNLFSIQIWFWLFWKIALVKWFWVTTFGNNSVWVALVFRNGSLVIWPKAVNGPKSFSNWEELLLVYRWTFPDRTCLYLDFS